MDMVLFSYLCFYFLKMGQTKSFSYNLYSENEKNGHSISSFVAKSVHACVIFCDNTFGCLSVNFHKENGTCVLTDYYPTDNTMSGVPESGWKIYFRRHFGVNLLEGASAWLSSTYRQEYANNALDGKQYTVAHANTGYSYWAVQFGTAGPVKGIRIFFRTAGYHYYRNTKFEVTVSNNRNDLIAGRGKHCGGCYGPAIDKAPFEITITCGNTIYGTFLKIQHKLPYPMVLGEVKILTPDDIN